MGDVVERSQLGSVVGLPGAGGSMNHNFVRFQISSGVELLIQQFDCSGGDASLAHPLKLQSQLPTGLSILELGIIDFLVSLILVIYLVELFLGVLKVLLIFLVGLFLLFFVFQSGLVEDFGGSKPEVQRKEIIVIYSME